MRSLPWFWGSQSAFERPYPLLRKCPRYIMKVNMVMHFMVKCFWMDLIKGYELERGSYVQFYYFEYHSYIISHLGFLIPKYNCFYENILDNFFNNQPSQEIYSANLFKTLAIKLCRPTIHWIKRFFKTLKSWIKYGYINVCRCVCLLHFA